MTTETGRRPTRETSADIEARLARLEEAVTGLGHRLGLIQWVSGGGAGVVVAIGTTLLARSFTLSDQIAALTERTAVTEQKVATLQIDFQDVRNEVRTANDRLTELRLIVGNIAVKLDAMPQHLPPPRKPGEP